MENEQQDLITLGKLRAKIDAIDESMHRLLIQRASVVADLILAKGASTKGAAFRPGREAEMMIRFQSMHEGNLPLTSIEHLWREIISTFTSMQAPFSVYVDISGDTVAAIDTARFYFGFNVPVIPISSGAEVLNSVANDPNALGIVLINHKTDSWWDKLARKSGLGIMARVPFYEKCNRQAASPAFIIAPPLADPVPFECRLHAISLPEELATETTLKELEIHDRHTNDGLTSLLVSGNIDKELRNTCIECRAVGGYAPPIKIEK